MRSTGRRRTAATPTRLSMTPSEWQEQVLERLRVAVARRMVADVPVGVLLSGGIDSSLVVALLAGEGQTDLTTFSIGFEAAGGESGDEFYYSDLIAHHFGTRHHQIRIPTSDVLPAVEQAIAAMSEPMVSHDCVAFFLLSREVSKTVRVVQSGQGADEIFAGYDWYPPLAGVAREDARRRVCEAYSSTVPTQRCRALLQSPMAAGRRPVARLRRRPLRLRRAPTQPSMRRCGSTARSCSSTIR